MNTFGAGVAGGVMGGATTTIILTYFFLNHIGERLDSFEARLDKVTELVHRMCGKFGA